MGEPSAGTDLSVGFQAVAAFHAASVRHVRRHAARHAELAPSRPVRRSVEREVARAVCRLDASKAKAETFLSRQIVDGEVADRTLAKTLRALVAEIEGELDGLSFVSLDDPQATVWLDEQAVEVLTELAVEFDHNAV